MRKGDFLFYSDYEMCVFITEKQKYKHNKNTVKMENSSSLEEML